MDCFGGMGEVAILGGGVRVTVGCIGALTAGDLRAAMRAALACVECVGLVGEEGLFFWKTEAAPPARELSSPMTLPPSTPPAPLTVSAMLWGAK